MSVGSVLTFSKGKSFRDFGTGGYVSAFFGLGWVVSAGGSVLFRASAGRWREPMFYCLRRRVTQVWVSGRDGGDGVGVCKFGVKVSSYFGNGV